MLQQNFTVNNLLSQTFFGGTSITLDKLNIFNCDFYCVDEILIRDNLDESYW